MTAGVSPTRKTGFPTAAAVVLLLLAGAGLRIAAAMDCFWFDEIWSYILSRNMARPWEVLTTINTVDNNHPLNTLCMYLMGEPYRWIWYRVPAIITGTLLLILIWRAAARFVPAAGIVALLLAAVSHPLVLYSSEARGYAPALFFSMASFFLIQQYWEQRNIRSLALFWITTALGLLSNLTAAFIWLAIILWSFIHELKETRSARVMVTELLKCHLAPLTLMAYLLHAYLSRNMEIGNIGMRQVGFIMDFLAATVAALMGTPSKGLFFVLGLILFLFILTCGWRHLYRTDRSTAIFFLLAVCLAPVMGNIGRQLMYFRFSLVAFPFVYILLAVGVVACFRGNRWAGLGGLLFLALFFYGNGTRNYAQITIGRGDYLGAVQYMAEHSRTAPEASTPGADGRYPRKGATVFVGSDHDFRNLPILKFYARYRPENAKIIYISEQTWRSEGTDWLILHSQWMDRKVPPSYRPNDRHIYRLEKIFPYAGVSGWNWYLYRRVPGLPPGDAASAGKVAPPCAGPGPHKPGAYYPETDNKIKSPLP